MPTPDHIRQASLAKRRRVCVICDKEFHVKSADRVGRTCSKEHQRIHISRIQKGRKQSPETITKRSESIRAVWADPEKRSSWKEATTEGIRRWHENEVNARIFAKRSSERMKRRHADPEWQKVHKERSSRTMRANWAKYRNEYVAAACRRYEQGIGINSEDSIKKKNAACTWILKQAQAALHTETNYDAVFTEVQRQLRASMPYDPIVHGDHNEYSRLLGKKVVDSAECREIADGFLATAIPKYAAEWRTSRAMADVA